MFTHDQSTYTLPSPYLGGYILDPTKSASQNISQLERYSLEQDWNTFFFTHRKNALLKKGGPFDWIVGLVALVFCIPLWQFYVNNMPTQDSAEIIFHIPLALLGLKYIGIWLYVSAKSKSKDYVKTIKAYYKEHWLDMTLFPLLNRMSQKAESTNRAIDDLEEQHLKMLTLSESPNVHTQLLQQTKHKLTQLELVIEAYKQACSTFEQLEQQLFFIKKNKEHQIAVNQQLADLSRTSNKLDKSVYTKRLAVLEPLIHQAEKLYVKCPKEPQQCIDAYKALMQKVV